MKLKNMNEKERDKTIDIMKGILILLMVIAHAQGPGHRGIYLFHMAVFFMISGYLWGDRNDIEMIQFIKRKLISLYIPYIICNTIYLLWFLCMPLVFDRKMCERTVTGIIYEVIKILLFRGRTSMSDPTWFLAVLFIVSVAYAIVRKTICKLTAEAKMNYFFISLSAIVAIAVGYSLYLVDFNLFQVGTICSSYAAFHMGNVVWRIKERNRFNTSNTILTCRLIFACVCGLLLYNISDIEIRLISNIIVNPVYYCLGMICGWIIVRYFSVIFGRYRWLRNLFSYLGRNSLIVLCAHFAAFKIIAYIQCLYFELPLSNISVFPVVRNGGYWWCAYTAVGIAVPLAIRYIFMFFKGRIVYTNNE